MLRPKTTNQRGDTIIEVLIALTVLGFVLGFSYASASRSLRTSQDAQERTEASQLAQSTIETIKAYATLGNPAIDAKIFPATNSTICVSTDISNVNSLTAPVSHPNPAVCNQGFYRTRVEVRPSMVAGLHQYEYAVYVEWDSIVSGNQNQAVMRYKWTRPTP